MTEPEMVVVGFECGLEGSVRQLRERRATARLQAERGGEIAAGGTEPAEASSVRLEHDPKIGVSGVRRARPQNEHGRGHRQSQRRRERRPHRLRHAAAGPTV
jgi:hypothetical protein